MLIGGSTRRRSAAEAVEPRVAVSSRVRLARNLRGFRFPEWADEGERRRVRETVTRAVLATGLMRDPLVADVAGLGDVTAQMLCESRVISQDLLERGAGAGLVVSADRRIAVMINEEDHLRIQVMEPGSDLQRAWAAADELDTRIEAHLAYAFSPQLGYLTACPSNVGTGLRASVMLHLLGLRLTNDLDAVLRALDRLRYAVRGVDGEGSDAAGHLFQISNQGTLGQDEAAVLDDLSRVAGEVARQERNARLRLARRSPLVLEDCVARAVVLLKNARVMSTEEALDYLSALRLGLELGLVRRLSVATLDELTLAVQPGHLQQSLGAACATEERDTARAGMLRKRLEGIALRA
jgi:protein arginine kinase